MRPGRRVIDLPARRGSLVQEKRLARTFSRSFAWRTRRLVVVSVKRKGKGI